MKATEIIAKFKEVLLSTVTPEIKEEVLLEEAAPEAAIEVSQEDNVETLELNEEVSAIEVTEEEVELSEELSTEEAIESEVELSEEVSEETEVELAEEAPVEEAPVVEAVKEEYASKEDLGKLSAEISALADLLNNMNPKKDVPQQLSAEEIEVKEAVEAEAEVIAISPEAEVKANFNHLNVPKSKGNSTKDIVWNKLFS
tara:strand:- start:372 stop:971 length:600 start_codon:yes stop_codon:yes gene_type:complete